MEKEKLSICPVCGKAIIDKNKFYGCEDCDFKLPKVLCNAEITIDNLKLIVEGKETSELEMVSNKGNAFKAKLKIKEDCSGVDFIFTKAEEVIVGECPICKNDVTKRNGLYGDYYKCSNKECTFRLNGTIAHKKITTEIAQKLLKDKITNPMTFISKNGREFNAKIVLDNSGNMNFEF